MLAGRGYSAGNKVFKSVNGGAAMDVGVFYRDNSLSAWVPYFANLPNVSVRELEISYGRTLDESRMRAAIFGRGLWETPLYNTSPVVLAGESGAPAAEAFSAVAEKGSRGVAIRFGTRKPGRYRAELTDLKGKILQTQDLGTISGWYQGRMEIGRGAVSGLHVLVLKGPAGNLAGRIIFE